MNVLLIVPDDLGVDKVSSYAQDYAVPAGVHLPDTAAVDALAASGLRFSAAWAAPACSPPGRRS